MKQTSVLRRARPQVTAPATMPQLSSNSTHPGMMQGSYLGSVTSLLGTLTTDSTTVPTESGVLGLPAAWRCLNLIANGVALMLTSAKVYDRDGIEAARPSIVARPNNLYTSYDFWFEVTATALMHGNYIGIKADYDVDGYARQIIPVHPSLVDCRIAQAGYPIYKIGDELYLYNQIVHVRGLTIPGSWWGYGVIEAQRKALVGSIDMQNYSNSVYRTGSVPSVIISLAGKNIPQATLDQVRSDWVNAHGSGQRKPAVLPEGITVEPLSWNPEDAQFLESRMLNIAEHAFMWGLDPTDLTAAVGTSSHTYANIQQRNIERITSSYGPWLNRIEQTWSDLLPDEIYVRGNPEALLRTDVTTRYEAYQTALQNNWMLIDEVRALENMPPLSNADGSNR